MSALNFSLDTNRRYLAALSGHIQSFPLLGHVRYTIPNLFLQVRQP